MKKFTTNEIIKAIEKHNKILSEDTLLIMKSLCCFCRLTNNTRVSFEFDSHNDTIFMQTFGEDKLNSNEMIQIPIRSDDNKQEDQFQESRDQLLEFALRRQVNLDDELKHKAIPRTKYSSYLDGGETRIPDGSYLDKLNIGSSMKLNSNSKNDRIRNAEILNAFCKDRSIDLKFIPIDEAIAEYKSSLSDSTDDRYRNYYKPGYFGNIHANIQDQELSGSVLGIVNPHSTLIDILSILLKNNGTDINKFRFQFDNFIQLLFGEERKRNNE